jgi:hypothetical protein
VSVVLEWRRADGPHCKVGVDWAEISRGRSVRLRLPPGTRSTSRLHTGYKTSPPRFSQRASAGEGLPNSRHHLLNVPLWVPDIRLRRWPGVMRVRFGSA